MIKIEITHVGKTVELTWSKGKIFGDRFTAAIVNLRIDNSEFLTGPEGMYWEGDDKRSSAALWWLLLDMFDHVKLLSGEITGMPTVPDGAIG